MSQFQHLRLSRQDYRNHRTLMVQGTTSDAGKSVLVTALCRILARQGIKVAPFKSQNMALNSAVTPNGGEIGRAQAVQAEACYIEPDVRMNPVLLKPNSDLGSQVIVRGKAIGNMKAAVYHQYKPQLLQEVVAAHDELRQEFDLIIVEGAGSPAEINLREHDLANMGFAEAVDCPVIIVADIDRGGVFAHLFGTFSLLSDSEQARVEGFVINRFRGDPALLQDGLDWLEDKTGKPVLAVLPFIPNLHIEAEDAIARQQTYRSHQQLKVVVPVYPRASNHTDFDALRMHPQVDCQLLRDIYEFAGADLIILPGSKNTRGDLAWLKAEGWDTLIQRHLRMGGKVMGICGGYQMLGEWIHDPDGSEFALGSCQGLGWLAIETTLKGEKQLRNVHGYWLGLNHTKQTEDINTDQNNLHNKPIKGYEIHVGETRSTVDKNQGAENLEHQGTGTLLSSLNTSLQPLCKLAHTHNKNQIWQYDGARNAENTVIGTYVHGVFDESAVTDEILAWAGTDGLQTFDYQAHRANEIDRLANITEQALPLTKLYPLLNWPLES